MEVRQRRNLNVRERGSVPRGFAGLEEEEDEIDVEIVEEADVGGRGMLREPEKLPQQIGLDEEAKASWTITYLNILTFFSVLIWLLFLLVTAYPNRSGEFFYKSKPYAFRDMKDLEDELKNKMYDLSLTPERVAWDSVTHEIISDGDGPKGLHSMAVDEENKLVFIAGNENIIYCFDQEQDYYKEIGIKLCEDLTRCDSPSLAFHNNSLYVSSLQKGLTVIDVSRSTATLLNYPVKIIGDKEELKKPLMKDISVAPNGKIYWVDYSLGHNYYSDEYYFESYFMDPFGRLVEYDPSTKEHRILISDLAMPGGVHVSQDGTYVLVAETLAARIRIHYLGGQREGMTSVYIDSLPGLPYSINQDGENSYSVGMLAYYPNVYGKYKPLMWAKNWWKRRTMFRALYYSRLLCQSKYSFFPLNVLGCSLHDILYNVFALPFGGHTMLLKIDDLENDYGWHNGQVVYAERFAPSEEMGGLVNAVRLGNEFYLTTYRGTNLVQYFASDPKVALIGYRQPYAKPHNHYEHEINMYERKKDLEWEESNRRIMEELDISYEHWHLPASTRRRRHKRF